MFELEDGTVVDTTNYNPSELEIFKFKFPNAKQVDNTNFQQDPADAETVVGSQNDMVSTSDGGLLELPDDGSSQRYFTYNDENGNQKYMSEEYYDRNLKGKKTTRGDYPDTFERYHAMMSQRGPWKDSISEMQNNLNEYKYGGMNQLEEVVVTGKRSEEQTRLKNLAEDVKRKRLAVTEESEKEDIVRQYFGIGDDGIIMGAEDREQYFPILKNPDGTDQMWQGKPRRSGFAEYVNDYETDLKKHLGEKKYNEYKILQSLMVKDSDKFTDEAKNNILNPPTDKPGFFQINHNEFNLSDYFNLDLVDTATKSQVVNKKRDSETQIFLRDFSEEEQDGINRYIGDEETLLKKEALYNKAARFYQEEQERAAKDKAEYQRITERPLMRYTIHNGKVYDPNPKKLDLSKGYDKILKEREKELIEEQNAFKADAEAFEKKYNTLLEYQSQIENYNVPDEIYNSPEEVQKRETLLANYENTWNTVVAEQQRLNNIQADLIKDIDILGESKAIDAAVLKNYEAGRKFGHVLEESFLGSGAMLTGSASAGIANFAEFLGIVDAEDRWYKDMMRNKQQAVDYNRQLQEYREIYLPDRLTKADSSSTGQYLADMIIENSPSILVALGTLGYGSAVSAGVGGVTRAVATRQATNIATGIFFTMEAGGQMSQLEIAQEDAAKLLDVTIPGNLITQYEEAKVQQEMGLIGQKEVTDIEELIEQQRETLNLTQFQKSFNSVMYGGIASAAERFGSLRFINNFQKYSKAVGGNTFRKQFGDALGTKISKGVGLTTGVGIGVGIETFEEGITLVGQNLSDNMIFQPSNPKSLVEGMDGEFFRNTFVTSLAISGPGVSQNIYSAVKNEITSRRQAQQEAAIKDELIILQRQINDTDLRTKEGRKLLQRKNELLADAAALNESIMLSGRYLSDGDIETIFENAAEIQRLRNEALALDPTDFNQKEFNRLKDKAQVLFDENQDILEKRDKAMMDMVGRKATNPVEAAVNSQRYFTFKAIAQNNKGTNVVDINNEADLNDYLDRINASQSQRAEILAGYNDNSNAFNNGNDIVLFNENIAAKINKGGIEAGIASVSPLHELGHIQIRKAGIIKNDKLVTKYANELVQSVIKDVQTRFEQGKIKQEEFDNFNARIDQYRNNKYTETEGVDADELIQLVSDFTALGILPRSSFTGLFGAKSFINSLLKRFNGEAAPMFQIRDAKDVYNFVSQFQNRAINMQLPAGEEEDSKIKQSATLDKVKDRLGTITKEKLNTPKAQNIIANELFGMVDAQIRNKLNLSPELREELQADVISRIILAQENTKWDGRGTLYGFLNGRIAKRMLDALRANPDYLDVVTKQELSGLEKASEVVVEDQPSVTKEKPKFKNLLQSNVLPADAIESVKKKLLSTVRVLKSKLNEPISINRTVTPLVAEIKKEMGKQADIEFKKRLGPKKDNILRKNYLRFKKPILENMTTTWLMTAMPFAVQKQVDGKFTSDWQGKKIDRETVDTDKAGRTSGADIVRRLPNVAERVTDEQFLSYMFKGDDVIRGRKESLSKALAEELAFDIFNSELQKPDSELRKAFVNNQAALGAELADNFVQEVQKDTERGNIKFSKGLATLTPAENKTFRDGLPKLKELIVGMDNDFGKTPTAIKKVLQNTYGDKFTKKQYDGISKQFFNLLKPLNKSFPRKYVNVSEQELKDYVDQVARDVDGNASIQLYTGASDSIKNLWNTGSNVYIAQEAVENALSKLPIETVVAFFSGTFANSGKVGMRNFNSSTETFRADFYAGKEQWLAALQRMFPEIQDVKQNGDIVLKDGKIIKKKFTATGSVTKGMLDAKFDTAKDIENANAAWEFTTAVVKGIKNENPDIQAMVLAAMNSGTNTSLRAAAPVLYKTAGFNSLTPSDYRYEHALPARRVLFDMYKSIVKGDKSIDLKALKDDYKVALIPKTMDKVIGDQGLGPIAVAGYVAGQTPWYSRYYNILTRGKVQYALESLENGEIIGQNYADYFNSTSDPLSVKPNAPAVVEADIQFEKALKFSKGLNYGINPKGITVLDFDDTVAISSSRVIVKMPVKDKDILDIAARRKFGSTVFKDKQDFQKTFDNLSEEQKQEVLKEVPGTTKRITPAEFAAESVNLENQGAIFDFSEFNKVVKGRKGPLFDLALKRQAKFGNNNIFILTARPQESAPAIQKFAKGLGLNLKLKNITGLADGRPEAKAEWIVGKVNEGFNDFYFADDALKNVKAVQEALDLFDVKSDVQQAKIKFSKGLNKRLNKMIERNTGVRAETTYSKALARRRGAKKGRFKFFLPYGAEDFRGLTSYVLAGKGKQGEADQAFFEENLVNPYVQGVAAMERARRALKNDYAGLRKMFPGVRKLLRKRIPDLDYTYDQALRIYLYNKSGFEIPGLSKRDLNRINKLIEGDADLKGFADGLQLITKKDKWAQPSEYWDSSSILQDLNEISEKVSRKEYLAEFIENVDAVFDEAMFNKLEAIYGKNYVEALKNIISRMKSGINRPHQPGKYERQWLNWVNNSVGTIMFFNRRSALLQMISFTNFINWSDNNPLKAGLAFANQPAYWKAWSKIFNSDKLKERRGGLKSDIQEQEIANQARNSKNKAGAITSYLLKIGFTPTQIADSMAIASGGATFLINRTKTYKKQGLSQAEAEAKAFEDFSKISDETQQSGDPMLISAQQSSHLGRLVLAFQNTPMQYTRLMKKAAQDIVNGRGDFKTNVSKIAYYGFIQNLIFNALQQALFAMVPGFDDEEEPEFKNEKERNEYFEKIQNKEEQKIVRIINGMADSILRGSGLYGAIASTLKNAYMRYVREEEKGFTADHTYTLLELANISPPIGSKLRKVYGAIQTRRFDREVMDERGLEVMSGGRLNLAPSYEVIGNLSSAFLNLPLDRAVAEVNALAEAFDDRNTAYQRIALALGWRTWDVNAKNEEDEVLDLAIKGKIKILKKKEAEIKKFKKKQEEFKKLADMTPEEKQIYLFKEKQKRSKAAKKAAETRARNKKIKDSILYSN